MISPPLLCDICGVNVAPFPALDTGWGGGSLRVVRGGINLAKPCQIVPEFLCQLFVFGVGDFDAKVVLGGYTFRPKVVSIQA
jgi:hypothetical protein